MVKSLDFIQKSAKLNVDYKTYQTTHEYATKNIITVFSRNLPEKSANAAPKYST